MGRVEILTGVERRRVWSNEEKLRILDEIAAGGLSVAAIARRHDILPQQIYTWRKRFIAVQAGLLAEQAQKLHSRDTFIEKLKAQLDVLKRARFGASSEKIERSIEQLELALEDIEAADAETTVPSSTATPASQKGKPSRQPLPDHLPRHDVVHDTVCACPVCGGAQFIKTGETVSEVLDYVPASFRVVRHIQPRFACKGCDTDIKAKMPSLPIERGKPGPGLLAHVLIAKYCDHLPLYRQADIYAREGVELSRSTMADWIGKASALMQPLIARLQEHVFAADRLHGDDTPVPVLEPGKGSIQRRIWRLSPVFFMPMAMQASANFTSRASPVNHRLFARLPAGHIQDGSSST